MLKVKSVLGNFYFALFGIMILGTYLLGFLHGMLVDVIRSNDLPSFISSAFSFLVLFYVLFSIFIVSKKSNAFSLLTNKCISACLGFYVCLCLLSFLFMGFFSPLTFAGSLSYQAYTGVNISTVFYPFIQQKENSDVK